MIGLFRAYTRLLNTHPVRTKALTSGLILSGGDVFAQMVIENKKLFPPPSPDAQRGECDAKGGDHAQLQYVDGWRTMRNGIAGLVVVGPSLHYWFHFLHSRFGAGRSLRTVAMKFLCHQVVATPYMVISVLAVTSVLQSPPEPITTHCSSSSSSSTPPPASTSTFLGANDKGTGRQQGQEQGVSTGATTRMGLVQEKVTGPKGREALVNAYKVWPVASAVIYGFIPLQYQVLCSNVVAFGWASYLAHLNYK
eukprot:Nk52_evm1s68 gene=Nk52_evmTU1s68